MTFAHAGVGQISVSPNTEWGVYVQGGFPNSPATLYSDQNMDAVVNPSFVTDANGVGYFFAAPGLYEIAPLITPPGENFFPSLISVPVNPLDSGSFNNPTFTGTVTFPDGSTFTNNEFLVEAGTLLNFFGYQGVLGNLEFETAFSLNQTHSLVSALPYTPQNNDVVIVLPDGVNRTVTPNVSTITPPLGGNFPTFILVTKSTGQITIAPVGANVNGQASVVMPGGMVAWLWCDGINWFTSPLVNNSPIIRPFSFAYNTANLTSGVTVYTPTVGDLLLDAWVEVDTAWNGSNPNFDFGTFTTNTSGLFANTSSIINLSNADETINNNAGLLTGNGQTDLMQRVISAATVSGGGFTRVLPLKFTANNPIKIVVSQNGAIGGASPGASQGSAVLYLVTATP